MYRQNIFTVLLYIEKRQTIEITDKTNLFCRRTSGESRRRTSRGKEREKGEEG